MKIIIIEKCVDCPIYITNVFDDSYCTKIQKRIPIMTASKKIHKECPLKDFIE